MKATAQKEAAQADRRFEPRDGDRIEIAILDVTEPTRPIDEDTVVALMASIREVGQLNPILYDDYRYNGDCDPHYAKLRDLRVVELEAVEALRRDRETDPGHKLYRKLSEPAPNAAVGTRMLVGAADGVEVALAYLGLTWSCTPDEAKARYRSLAANVHPDRGGSTEASATLNQAYETVKRWIDGEAHG